MEELQKQVIYIPEDIHGIYVKFFSGDQGELTAELINSIVDLIITVFIQKSLLLYFINS